MREPLRRCDGEPRLFRSCQEIGDVAVHHRGRSTFAACLVAYGFLRNGTPNWPTPFKFSPTIINAMVMTFILITSSLTMLLAVRCAQARRQGRRFPLDHDHRRGRHHFCPPAPS